MIVHELTLFTPHLKQQADFYETKLGLSPISQDGTHFTIQIGRSLLRFEQSLSATPYHFAINIPANQEIEALAWLKKRITVLKDGATELIDFSAWNAKAMYFYDYDKNIVELIARKNLWNTSAVPFNGQSFLEISEIGLPTENIKTTFSELNQQTGIEIYSGSFKSFCAIGGEHGLFICIDVTEKATWYPVNAQVYFSDFRLRFEVGSKTHQMDFKVKALHFS